MKPLPLASTRPPRPAASVAARPSPSRLRIGAGTVRELYRTLVEGGRWWLVPMLAVLGLATILLAALATIEYVAPFVYTVF